MARLETKALGELCQFQRGLAYGKSDEVDFSENVVLRANNIDLETHTLDFTELRYISDSVSVPPAKRVRKDSLLICTASGSKSHLGKIAYIDADYGYAFGGFMGQITPATGIVARYLFYVLTSPAYKAFIEALSDGANINNLKFDDLRRFPVPIPSIDEQQRIVAILDKAFESIATAKANTAKKLKKVSELEDAIGEACFVQAMDGSFAPRQLSDLCDLIVDCEHKTAPTQESGYPSIRTPNIGKGKLILRDVNRVSRATYLAWTRRATPMPGDLILAREAPAGNVAVVPDGMEVCLGQRTVLIRPRRDLFEPEYLAHLLLQRSSQRRLLAHSRGATVQHVNMKDIRAFMISAVPSLATQRQAIEKLRELDDACESLRAAQQRKVNELDELKKSLLKQAMTGQFAASATGKQLVAIA